MTLMALLIRLRKAGIWLGTDDAGLYLKHPGDVLVEELQTAIREHEHALMRLPRPYLNVAGELIVPCDAPPQYHWQPITDTLREVGASAEEWRRHTSKPYPDDLLSEEI